MAEGSRPAATSYGEDVSPRAQSLLDRFRNHPTATDGLVSALLYAAGLWQMAAVAPDKGYVRADARDVVVVTIIMIALALRQRAPFTVLMIIMVGNVLIVGWSFSPTVAEIIAYLIAIYTVAAHRALAVSTAGGALAIAGYTCMATIAPDAQDNTVVGYTINVALIGGVWWLGRSMRLRRAYEAELEHRAARLEQARDTDARAARVEERSRIARELHDVVAHHVSVMTVQAGAARRIIDKSPDTAREAMETIEETGRTALSEMRRIVGVLRTERDERDAGPPAELAPQPGIHDVGLLIDSVRETGLSVQLWVEGEPHPLPPGVNLAAYRLIQEALTNTLKHAGPQARAWVRIHYGVHELSVQIEDNGRGVAAGLADDPGAGPAGHGMVGMHERVALYGGRLRIGPRIGGGFEVRAVFPLD